MMYGDVLIRAAIDHSYNWRIHVEDSVTSNRACSEQLKTSLKMRYKTIVRCNETVVFQRDIPCTNHKNTSYIFTVSYLILIHL